MAAAAGVALLANLTVLAQWLAGMVALGGGHPQPDSGLEALRPFLAGLVRWPTGQGHLLPFDYWYQATRIIPFTINEFPFFSFVFADLHPHMMSLPFTIATLVLLAGLLLAPRRSAPRWQGGALALLGLTVGALGPLNTWDLPTYLGLAVLVVVWLAMERGSGWWGLGQALVVATLAYVLYLPFYAHYLALPATLRFLPNHTALRYFLVVWGLWLVALYGWLSVRWWRGRDGAGRLAALLFGAQARRARRLMRALSWRPTSLTRWRWLMGGAAVALSALALLAGESVVALLVPPVAWGLDLWLRPRAQRSERLAGLLAAGGCLILAGSELVYLADFLQGSEWQRMNTVFKFGIQAWTLLALAAAVGLPAMLAWVRDGGLARQAAWAAVTAVLVGLSLAYVPLSIVARANERFPGGPPPTGTLDGLAYMRNGVYTWPDEDHTVVLRYDYDAIRWLIEHVRGTPVIAEAPLGYYREGGTRVSSYTGLPTLLGAHQVEQRPAEMVAQRHSEADRLYRSLDRTETLALMRKLQVRYVYFGQLEENVYGGQARAKFDELAGRGEMEVVFANPKVTIYHLKGNDDW